MPLSEFCSVSLNETSTPLDLCYFCIAKLNPCDLVFDVKTSVITILCKNCRTENEAGKIRTLLSATKTIDE